MIAPAMIAPAMIALAMIALADVRWLGGSASVGGSPTCFAG